MKTLIKYLKENAKTDYKYFLKDYSFLIAFGGIIVCAFILILDILINNTSTSLSLISIILGLLVCLVLVSDSIINK